MTRPATQRSMGQPQVTSPLGKDGDEDDEDEPSAPAFGAPTSDALTA